MSTTTSGIAASSKNLTSNTITYSGTTLSYNLSSYSNNIGIINTPYIPLTIGNGYNPFSNNTYSWGAESLETKIQSSISKLTPIILHHRKNGVIRSSAIITMIYQEFSKQIQFFDEMEKKMENYKTLWEISRCNEAYWVMNARHENSSIALLCSQLILHVH
jgi:hypothetical protein